MPAWSPNGPEVDSRPGGRSEMGGSTLLCHPLSAAQLCQPQGWLHELAWSMSPPPDTHIQAPRKPPSCPYARPPKLSLPGSQPQAAEAREPAMEGLEVRLAPMGGGGGGDAKNGEPLQASRREREEVSREDGSQAGILAELRDAKGQREKQPGPFQGVGMGDKPQVAWDGQGNRRRPVFPHPHPKLRNGDWQQQPLGSAQAWGGGGGQAGRQTKCHQAGHGGCQPAVPTPPAQAQSPHTWSFRGGGRWGSRESWGSSRQSQAPSSRGQVPKTLQRWRSLALPG